MLDDAGFTILGGLFAGEDLAALAAAYDAAVARADPKDVSIGSATTRVSGFAGRDPMFDRIYIHPPLLEACSRLIGQSFQLSTLHARTLRAHSPAQDLHVDFERSGDGGGWPMVGFIVPIDDFISENGATRFLPGSQNWRAIPPDLAADRKADYPGQVLACAVAGSMILYNGSVWHGHTANRTGLARRSIQGAYVRRDAR